METGLANNKIKLLVLAAFLVTMMILGLCACESKHDLKTVKKQVEQIKEGKKYKVKHTGVYLGAEWSITKDGILILEGDASQFSNKIAPTIDNSWLIYTDEIFGAYIKLEHVITISGLCRFLENAVYVDLSGLQDDSLTNMKGIVACCTSLQEVNFGNLNTAKVTDFSELFIECSSIKKIDLSSLNMDSANDIAEMFNECHSLEEVIFPEEVRASQIDFAEYMFCECKNLSAVDLSMFGGISNDLISYGMFLDCEKLETVYLNQAWDVVPVEDLLVPDGVQVIYVNE